MIKRGREKENGGQKEKADGDVNIKR